MTSLNSLPGEHTLPGGTIVNLRDITTLRAKDKKNLARWVAVAEPGPERQFEIDTALARIMVDSWLVPYLDDAPLPRDQPDVLDELTTADYDALSDLLMPVVAVLYPPAPSPEDASTPGSPTGPANA